MNQPEITCKKCGGVNAVDESHCWKCNSPIAEQQTEVAHPPTDYKTSILVAKLVSAAGWTICGIAAFIVIAAVGGAGRMGLVALVPGLGILMGGLVLVVAGQSARALMDIANFSAQILEELRRRAA